MNQNSLVQNLQNFKKVPNKASFKRKSLKISNKKGNYLYLGRLEVLT